MTRLTTHENKVSLRLSRSFDLEAQKLAIKWGLPKSEFYRMLLDIGLRAAIKTDAIMESRGDDK